MIPFLIVIAVIVIDQVSKYIILTTMQLGESFNLIKYVLNITFTTNTGASFGILKNHRWVFMILSTVALVLMAASIVYLMQKKLKGNTVIITALSLMLGGGSGNMIDRVIRGEVVDFFEFAFVNFAIFNAADSFICIGSVLFCICVFSGKYSLFDKDKKDKAGETETTGENTENGSVGDIGN